MSDWIGERCVLVCSVGVRCDVAFAVDAFASFASGLYFSTSIAESTTMSRGAVWLATSVAVSSDGGNRQERTDDAAFDAVLRASSWRSLWTERRSFV